MEVFGGKRLVFHHGVEVFPGNEAGVFREFFGVNKVSGFGVQVSGLMSWLS